MKRWSRDKEEMIRTPPHTRTHTHTHTHIHIHTYLTVGAGLLKNSVERERGYLSN